MAKSAGAHVPSISGFCYLVIQISHIHSWVNLWIWFIGQEKKFKNKGNHLVQTWVIQGWTAFCWYWPHPRQYISFWVNNLSQLKEREYLGIENNKQVWQWKGFRPGYRMVIDPKGTNLSINRRWPTFHLPSLYFSWTPFPLFPYTISPPDS